jgi:hypothetical protein
MPSCRVASAPICDRRPPAAPLHRYAASPAIPPPCRRQADCCAAVPRLIAAPLALSHRPCVVVGHSKRPFRALTFPPRQAATAVLSLPALSLSTCSLSLSDHKMASVLLPVYLDVVLWHVLGLVGDLQRRSRLRLIRVPRWSHQTQGLRSKQRRHGRAIDRHSSRL